MSISPKKKLRIKSNQKVAILLQDHDATARVYVEIQGELKSREVMVEALKRLEDGLIYADENCTELIESEYIEVFPKKTPYRREEEDFIFLIDRAYAEDYVVSAKIIK
ncbi:hypothetical protein GC098_17030 [Paenibacillus sp. LMG 31458]|jgi:hypothetical protein|uniref:Uncharacterized protein n=2 Tax=Paenibacillus TaxID=44249 RepID=A0ABX1ZHU0_9BACL|nr:MULTISPECIES: hypothetical protein [Paenibacillus]NOU73101.1 hypothetical protein [Paenibacillus phytorum]NOU91520.1 hypothetical protein [Paenibacillus germinis]